MIWNWQAKEWPDFKYDKSKLNHLEERFIYNSGVLFGAYVSISEED